MELRERNSHWRGRLISSSAINLMWFFVCVAEDVLDASLEDETITEEYQAEQGTIMRKAAEWVAGSRS